MDDKSEEASDPEAIVPHSSGTKKSAWASLKSSAAKWMPPKMLHLRPSWNTQFASAIKVMRTTAHRLDNF